MERGKEKWKEFENGNLTLSYNIYDGKYSGDELKENEFFPPDWTDEVDNDLCTLCRERFENPVGTHIQEIQDNEKDDELFCDAFGEAYINSVRKVLVRLENENAFSVLNTTDDVWLIVTEIDADTDEEESKLNEIRKQFTPK